MTENNDSFGHIGSDVLLIWIRELSSALL